LSNEIFILASNKCEAAACEQLCLPAQIDRSKSGRSDNPVPYTCQCSDGYTIADDGQKCKKSGKLGFLFKNRIFGKVAYKHFSDTKSAGGTSKGGRSQEQQPIKKAGNSSAAVAVAVIGCLATVGVCVSDFFKIII
jgi:hypothetical protein